MRLTRAVIRTSLWENDVEYPYQEYQRQNPKDYREECEDNVYVDDLNEIRSYLFETLKLLRFELLFQPIQEHAIPLQAGNIPAGLGSNMPVTSIINTKKVRIVNDVAISHLDKVFIRFSCFNFS